MKPIPFILFSLCFFLTLFPCFSKATTDSTISINADCSDNWRYKLGDNLDWKEISFDDSSWTEIALPGKLPMNDERGYYWMRTTVKIPKELNGDKVWFDTGMTGTAFDIYIDGIFIGSHGRLPPNYNARMQLYKALVVPSNLYEDDGEIVIALRGCCYSSLADFNHFALCNEVKANEINYAKTIFNVRMYLVLSILCIFIGLYFIFQFQFDRKRKDNLYFAIALLSIAFYFYDMGSERIIFPIIIQRMLGRSMLPISMGFLLLFFLSHYHEKSVKILKPVTYIAMGVSTLLYICMTGKDAELNLLFLVMLLPVFVTLIYCFVIIVRALKRKERNVIPMLIGFVVGIFFALHDIVYQAMGAIPFAWLQGLSFFCLNISVFISLSLESARMQRDLDLSTNAIQEQRDSLATLIKKAENLSGETSAIAMQLDSSVGSVAEDTFRLAEEAGTIGGLVEKQNDAISSAKAAVEGLSASFLKVSKELENEVESISRTVDGTATLIKGFSTVGEGISGAARFSGELNGMLETERGNIDVLSSSMEVVKAYSADIKNVVNIVNEFAAQTNLLAMNASIEAAHAGVAGKGFTVIAQEIKKLAEASAQQAGKISEMVSGIEKSIEEGFNQSVKIKAFLSDIEEGAKETAVHAKNAAEDMRKQEESGDEILKESRLLSSSADNVKKEAMLQNEYSEKVHKTILDLEEAALKVGNAAADIIRHNEETAKQSEEMKEIASRSRKASEELTRLMQIKN